MHTLEMLLQIYKYFPKVDTHLEHCFVPIIPSFEGTTHVIFHPVEGCAWV
jgi:hypothetical protein